MGLVQSFNKNLGLILLGERADYVSPLVHSHHNASTSTTTPPPPVLLPESTPFGECFERIDVRVELPEFFRRHRSDRFYHLLWLQFPLGMVGFVAVTLFIVAVVRAMMAHRVSRKFYLLLLNRVFADYILIVCLVLIAYYNMSARVTALTAWLNFISNLCFWAAMVSYISLSLLKLYGIARPLHYRKNVVAARCKRLIGYSWLTFTALILAMVMVGVFLQRVVSKETWLAYTQRANSVLTIFPALVYITTVACFLCTRKWY